MGMQPSAWGRGNDGGGEAKIMERKGAGCMVHGMQRRASREGFPRSADAMSTDALIFLAV